MVMKQALSTEAIARCIVANTVASGKDQAQRLKLWQLSTVNPPVRLLLKLIDLIDYRNTEFADHLRCVINAEMLGQDCSPKQLARFNEFMQLVLTSNGRNDDMIMRFLTKELEENSARLNAKRIGLSMFEQNRRMILERVAQMQLGSRAKMYDEVMKVGITGAVRNNGSYSGINRIGP